MKSTGVILAILMLTTACGRTGTSVQHPPLKYRGTWAFAGAQPAENATDVKVVDLPANNDPCDLYTVKGKTVDAGLMKIDGDGNVFSAKKISSTDTSYVRIGKIKPDGMFLPMAGSMSEYSTGYSKLASGTVTVEPYIFLRVDKKNRKALAMEIKAMTNSAAGLFISGTLETRHFEKITADQEKTVIAEALGCLE